METLFTCFKLSDILNMKRSTLPWKSSFMFSTTFLLGCLIIYLIFIQFDGKLHLLQTDNFVLDIAPGTQKTEVNFKVNVGNWLNNKSFKSDPQVLEDGRPQESSELNHESHWHNNWTILLTVNDGYFFFQNWFVAYRKLNIKYPIVIVAEDELVYKKLRPFQSESVTIEKSGLEDVKKSAMYGSKEFTKLVSQRPTHILRHLTKGKNILYSDIDMVWLQNPFPYFTGDFDMWIALDRFDIYCTGFMAIKSNKKCLILIKSWQNSLQLKPEIDQTTFNKVVKSATIDISSLDNRTFPAGQQYFDTFTDKQRSLVVFVHNNWVIGKNTKLKRFKKYKLWYVPV